MQNVTNNILYCNPLTRKLILNRIYTTSNKECVITTCVPKRLAYTKRSLWSTFSFGIKYHPKTPSV